MAADQQVIWECFLMRRERDLEWLWQGQQAGDPLGRKFFTGLGGWLEKCRKTPVDEAPQCLTCEQTFCDPTQMPLTFLVTHSEDPRISALVLTGVPTLPVPCRISVPCTAADVAPAVAVTVVPQSSDRVEDEQRRTHGDRQMPRRQLVAALRTAFVPGVAHL